MQQGVLLQQCTQRQLEVQKGLHQLACQEAVLIKEKTEHEHQYDTKDVQEVGGSARAGCWHKCAHAPCC